MPEMSESSKSPFPTAALPSFDIPPPYTPVPNPTATNFSLLSPNPGFCAIAFSERHANRTPGGGMTASQYFSPCPSCGVVVGDRIPGKYKEGWREWVDPSVNFRWESHIPPSSFQMKEKERGGERGEEDLESGDIGKDGTGEKFGCWICWEYEERWVQPMEPEEWYIHLRKHFRDEGFRVCKGKTGGMQRKRNCAVNHCPKIHS